MDKTNAFQNSFVKEMIRTELHSRMVNHFGIQRGLSCFTLPGDSFSFENKLFKTYGARLTLEGVERNTGVYENAIHIRTDRGPVFKCPVMNLHLMDDSDYWPTCKKKFHALWLDYCGSWSQEKLESILNIIGGDNLDFSAGNPLIALTLSGAREGGALTESLKLEISDLVSWKDNDSSYGFKARAYGIPRIINQEVRKLGVSMIPQIIVYYRDATRNKHSYPMFLYLFEVFRGRKNFKPKKTPVLNLTADYFETPQLH